MRKKCVRWAKPVLATLVASAVIVLAWSIAPLSAQSTDPSTQPRLAFADLMYVGGFRLPAGTINGDHFQFGGRQLTFNPANNSLFIGSRAGRVAEISIPNAVNSSNPAAMPFATYLQGFADPTENHLSQILTDGVALDGLLVVNNRLIGSASVFYDADNLQRVSHYSRSLQLNEPSFSGWSSVWNAARTGFVSGTMSVIPTEWRALLGGDAATGQCCIPIVSRTSFGPSAFAFNASQVGQSLVPAAPLLYYTGDHTTLGPWDGSNGTYGSTTFMGGMAIIAGTRTALYLGRNGLGVNCYGNGTSNQSLVGSIGPDGAHYCYDPTSSDKGSHAYPYRYQIWAYDLNDFAAVKAGTKQPWEITPYGVWPLELPTPEKTVRLGGVGYDPVHQLLYVSQMYADTDGYASRPVIHVLQINAAGSSDDGGSGTLPPPVTTTPPPAVIPPTTPPTITPPTTTPPPVDAGTIVKSISLAVNRNAPQVTGTATTFTVSVVGGVMPHEYKWVVFNGTAWQTVKDWSTVESFTWTPGTANDQYRVGVWARSSGNTRDEAEASVSTSFAIIAPTPVRSVTFAANKPAPQVAGTAITFTAVVDGGQALEHKWLVHDGLAWSAATGWSSQNAFLWTPASASPYTRIGVWVRSNGSTNDVAEATWSSDFPITAPPAATAPSPAPATSGPVRSVTFSADKPAPQPFGTAITFTAAVDGGTAVQYKWLMHDGLAWAAVSGWSTQHAFTWTPATVNPDTRIGLWVRSNGSTNDLPEATWSADFAISAAPPGPIAAVSLSISKPSSQPPGTTIVLSATATGGGPGTQYRWLIHDGVQWNIVSGWTTSSTFAWTPTAANPYHFIGVWSRRAGSTSETPEATTSQPFVIQ